MLTSVRLRCRFGVMDAKEIADLKRKLEDKHRQDMEAVDRVLALLEETHSANAKATPEETPTTEYIAGRSTKAPMPSGSISPFFGARDSGIRGIAKEVLPFLPEVFGRERFDRSNTKTLSRVV